MILRLLLCFLCYLTASYAFDLVTCGTVLKLGNRQQKLRLHSHEVKYGSGSGQQSVTGMTEIDDHNSYWKIKAIKGQTCKRGEPIKCGQKVRLQHSSTGCNLHSHHFSSPLSSNQEVSCFGEGGEGDTGDFWEVICDDAEWHRSEDVKFKHMDTGMYLGISGHKFGRPIHGQFEIAAFHSPSMAGASWIAEEGIFVKPTEMDTFANPHTEL